jgi:hypothetical protein
VTASHIMYFPGQDLNLGSHECEMGMQTAVLQCFVSLHLVLVLLVVFLMALTSSYYAACSGVISSEF